MNSQMVARDGRKPGSWSERERPTRGTRLGRAKGGSGCWARDAHTSGNWCTHDAAQLLIGDLNGELHDDFLCQDLADGAKWIDYASASGQFLGNGWQRAANGCRAEPIDARLATSTTIAVTTCSATAWRAHERMRDAVCLGTRPSKASSIWGNHCESK